MNKLICGDNLEELAKLPKESIDLVYIDPPFFTHKQYEVVWGDEAEVRSFEDRWEGGIEHYIGWMKPRVQLMWDVLKPTGSFYLHCDWHASAHLRIMMDDIFGRKNLLREIIWSIETASGYKSQANMWIRGHDTILLYKKGDEYTFNKQFYPLSEKTIKRYDKVDKNGRRYKIYYPKGGKKKVGNGEARKVYLDQSQGRPITDVWTDIVGFQTVQKKGEYLGYPTQKPEALLERIIRASSHKGDLVLDVFCGCGTALAVAQILKRKWIGIDISPTAVETVEDRLNRMGAVKGKTYLVIGMPETEEGLRKLKPFEFQNWVIKKMRARQSRKKVGDMGLDGYIHMNLYHGAAGIQVKQSGHIGRNVVDNFETALRRAKYNKGYIVAFSFSKGAHEEVARLKNKGELEITLVTVENLLYKKEPLT